MRAPALISASSSRRSWRIFSTRSFMLHRILRLKPEYRRNLAAEPLSENDRRSEPIQPFEAHGLHGKRAQTLIRSHHLQAAARALNVAGGVFGFDDLSVTRDVVHDNDAAAARQLDGPIQIVWIVV